MEVANSSGGLGMRDGDGQKQATYVEVHGLLEGRGTAAPSGDVVMLTNVDRGSGLSRPLDGLTLRYVGRGEEHYAIGGKSFRVPEGHLMLSRQNDGAEIDIRRSEPRGTLGLCAFLAHGEGDLGALAGPIVIGGSCSPVGALMKSRLRTLLAPAPGKSAQAALLAEELRCSLPALLAELSGQAEGVHAMKPATRLDALRKVNTARAYLHSVTSRAVPLEELAQAVGVSRFHLLRTFQQCLGETPAVYHRRLRLTLALAEAKRRALPLDSIADEYGFAGVSSLSHAHRRVFGRAPIWSKLGTAG